jgi:type I restriction enzyme, S subunit
MISRKWDLKFKMKKAKPGYKLVQSLFRKEIEIPEDWTFKQLKNLTKITDGSHFSPDKVLDGFPMATVENVNDDMIDIDSCYQISKKDFEQSIKNGNQPVIGDILFTKDGTVGKTLVYNQNEKVVLLSSIAIIRKSENLDSVYCNNVLQSKFMKKHLAKYFGGTAIKRIVLKHLSIYEFPVPSKKEQQKIASILTNVDDLILSHSNAVVATQKLKTGLMQTLLTRGIRHKKFKKVKWIFGKEIEIPVEWNFLPLFEVIKLKNGFAFKSKFFVKKSDKIVITPGNFHKNGGVYFEDRNSTFYKGEIPHGFTLDNGDLLIVMTDLTRDGVILGNSIILKSEYTILHNQRIAKVLFKQSTDKYFLNYFLNSFLSKQQIKKTSAGTGVIHTSTKKILELIIPLPSFPEQQKIALILSNVDKKIYDLESKKNNLKEIKKGLIQKLLTGQIRVAA